MIGADQSFVEVEENFRRRHGIRVLFVLRHRDNTYGCDGPYGHPYGGHLSSGLLNSARFVVEMLNDEGFHTRLVQVVDNNHIHRHIVEFKANIVIIEAYWVVPPKFDELMRVCPHVKFVVRNHSDLAFMANEGNAIDWTMKYLDRRHVWMSCNSMNSTGEVRFLAQLAYPEWPQVKVEWKVPFLPNYYPTDNAKPPREPKEEDVLDIGCFGAIRPLKNQLVQAVAALKYAAREEKFLRFHINATRIEGQAGPILRNLVSLFSRFTDTAELVQHDWLPHHEFIHLMRKMDVSMQVSFSETFNIVTCDAVTNGIPIVVSKEIPWVPDIFQASTIDIDDIVDKIDFSLHFPEWYPGRNPSLSSLDRYDDRSIKQWSTFLMALDHERVE